MAKETFKTRLITNLTWCGKPKIRMCQVKTGITTIFPASIVKLDGTNDKIIDLNAASTTVAFAYVLLKKGHEIDTAYAALEWIPVLVLAENCGVGVWVHVLDNTAVVGGVAVTGAAGGYVTLGALTATYYQIGFYAESQATVNGTDKLQQIYIQQGVVPKAAA